jgi:hypothetical protein
LLESIGAGATLVEDAESTDVVPLPCKGKVSALSQAAKKPVMPAVSKKKFSIVLIKLY